MKKAEKGCQRVMRKQKCEVSWKPREETALLTHGAPTVTTEHSKEVPDIRLENTSYVLDPRTSLRRSWGEQCQQRGGSRDGVSKG